MPPRRVKPKEEGNSEIDYTTYPIPEEHEDESDAWKHAFRHAMSMKYTAEKGAILYAEAHQFDDRHVDATE